MGRKQRRSAHRKARSETPIRRPPPVSSAESASRNNPPSISDLLTTQGAAAAPALVADAEHETVNLILDIYRYRHLLRNLSPLYEERKREEREKAPRITGARVAAVLARLWATEDLGLSSVPQKSIGEDLDIAPSEIGKLLKQLRSDKQGPACVKLVSDQFGREHVYEITDEGKRQLTQWLFFHVAPRPYREAANAILKQLDRSKVEMFLQEIKMRVREFIK